VEVGFATDRDAAAAWRDFRGWRVNYEDLAYRWANRVLAPPAPWSGLRAGFRDREIMPRRPPHRSPDHPGTYRRPDVEV
jgi:hypothetical protein